MFTLPFSALFSGGMRLGGGGTIDEINDETTGAGGNHPDRTGELGAAQRKREAPIWRGRGNKEEVCPPGRRRATVNPAPTLPGAEEPPKILRRFPFNSNSNFVNFQGFKNSI